jgi:hypothetical protein
MELTKGPLTMAACAVISEDISGGDVEVVVEAIFTKKNAIKTFKTNF